MIDLKLEHVSKRYRIRREVEADAARHPLVRKLQSLRRPSEEFWAVRDVSFEVERGEALGIIGHNGAGKSTVLKLLSSITAPTSGEITINGRLSALIEVGSGFHPELTGRENIYLNGSILGMRRHRITEKLDSIVEFAGVRQFLDTPVKRFSSGMYVRLGFSIAAHLDPDILLLDEVLAVGDAAFQAKCLQRIGDLKRSGTTIVFISHDLSAVERLCDRVVLLRRGEVVANGAPRDVITQYQNTAAFQSSQPAREELANQQRLVEIGRLAFRDAEGRETSVLRAGEPFTMSLGFTAHAPVADAVFEVFFYSADRELQCQCTTEVLGGRVAVEPGAGAIEFSGPGLGLLTGVYYTDVVIKERGSTEFFDWSQWDSAALRVDPGKLVRGKFYMPCEWRLTQENEAAASAPAETTRA
ncbi:MAG TPA: ABC transporter ATP-binding protein [Pyrinomonadaceae bacterium]|jgi:ABC-type polysaccharide/polyol phosphate transport system ATPase subunit|nr:ABC transporter ATP-binding protein [Pyrinomonadaceae bacterium]